MNMSELRSPEPAIGFRRTPAQQTNPFLAWNRTDQAFFAAGACHFLAFRVVERFPDAGLSIVHITPAEGHVGSHVYVTDGLWAFDFNGWSPAGELWVVNADACTADNSAWTGEQVTVTDDLATFCAANNHRLAADFAGDVVARADRFIDQWANGGVAPVTDEDRRRLRSARYAPVARFSLVALDCPNPMQLAEFYISIVGGRVIEESATADWVRVRMPGSVDLGFQLDPNHVAPVWPDGPAQQAHLDFDVDDLDRGEAAVIRLGAVKAGTQPSPDEWRVFLDPAGHPFCLIQV